MILGADFSVLEEVENCGGRFFAKGKEASLIEHLVDAGVNAARLRLWVDPYGEDGQPYMGGTCGIDTVERLAKRAKEAGMQFLLDLHYSDFWCDPHRQVIPKAWQGRDSAGLCQAIREFTARTLDRLDRKGLSPDSVQVGNEITNGMLWPVGRLTGEAPRQGYDTLAAFLRAGCEAVRQGSDSRIVLHLENSGNNRLWREWFDAVTGRDVDFDIIGASYYPVWHGTLEDLYANLGDCVLRYGKDAQVVETAYPFTTQPFKTCSAGAALWTGADGKRFDGTPLDYPLDPQGQADFLKAVLSTVARLPQGRGTGVYWWEPGWLPVEGTSWASNASLRYCAEEGKALGNEWANQCLFDYEGNALPALDVFRNF